MVPYFAWSFLIFKFQFAGQCPVTIRDWKAGNNRYATGPTPFLTASVKFQFVVQFCNVPHTFPLGGRCPEGADEGTEMEIWKML